MSKINVSLRVTPYDSQQVLSKLHIKQQLEFRLFKSLSRHALLSKNNMFFELFKPSYHQIPCLKLDTKNHVLDCFAAHALGEQKIPSRDIKFLIFKQ